MGTQQTNDDGALGLPLVALGPDSTRRLAVIRDEQRMADVLAQCALSVTLMRGAAGILDIVAKRLGMDLATAKQLVAAADSLESAIARANGGAQ